MMDEFEGLVEFEYQRIISVFERKKKKILDHLDQNKDTQKLAFDRILEILENSSLTFDFSLALQEQFYQLPVTAQQSVGVKDWSYPAERELQWSNSLTGIAKCGKYEFNFLFKDGKTSDAPMSGQATEVVNINPPDSVVRRVNVFYELNYYVYGFQLFDAENTCILQIGRLSGDTLQILIEAEDRIVGMRSKLFDAKKALHTNLKFVIGRPTL